MTGWAMIHEAELLAALGDVEDCQDCHAGRGVHVDFATGDFDGVTVHNTPCPRAPRPKGTTLRLVDTDSHIRCRRCSGLLSHDIGGNVFGNVTGEERCLRCEPRPSSFDTDPGSAL